MVSQPPIEYLVEHPNPVLSICICHIQSRAAKFKRLTNILRSQVTPTLKLPVEILVSADNREHTSGSKRHALSVASKGKYISFVDDDDTVTDDYVEDILDAAASEPEVITFYVLVDHQDVTTEKTYRLNIHTLDVPHDLERRGVQNDPDYGKLILVGMLPSHLNAWRRDIQRKVAYNPDLNCQDDAAWIGPLMNSGFVTQEVHLEKILYNYEFSIKNTVNQNPAAQKNAKHRVKSGLECFKNSDSIFIAVNPIDVTKEQSVVVCRDNDNNLVDITRSEFEQYHTYTVPYS
ncbi:MAG: hypothetical protein CMC15_16490 [Flavobacteriaceae bacterium]|nr:hypothetical protein [Flavobacteriaceae bacterium]